MRKPILYYLAGVLSAIAVPLALWGILYSAVGGSDYDVISTSTSPDKKYVATVYSSMGAEQQVGAVSALQLIRLPSLLVLSERKMRESMLFSM
jgi:hypothetical protein